MVIVNMLKKVMIKTLKKGNKYKDGYEYLSLRIFNEK